ncbi:MAG: outer membrane beta-barrel protein [Pseudomonadota bacterium]
MRQRLFSAAATGVLALAAGAASADGLSYSYLEPRWAETELEDDTFDIDGDGFVFNGSLEFSETVHLFVGYERLEFDDNVDVSTRLIGGGLAVPLSPRADLVFRGGFVDAEFETPFFSDDDEGTFLSAGARVLVTPEIELYGDFRSINLDDAGDEESTTIGLEFYASDSFSVGPSVTWVDDVTTYTLGGRIYF